MPKKESRVCKKWRHIISKLGRFRWKLLLCMLLMGILPTVVLGNSYYRIAYRNAEATFIDSFSLIDQQAAAEVDVRLAQLASTCEYIRYNVDTLMRRPYRSADEYIEAFKKTRNQLGALQSNTSTLSLTVFLPEEQFFGFQGMDFMPLSRLDEFNMSKEELMACRRQFLWKVNPQQKFVWTFRGIYEPMDVIGCWGYSSNWITGELFYAYVVFIACDEFNTLLRNTHPDDALESYLVQQDGLAMGAKDESLIGKPVDTTSYGDDLATAESQRKSDQDLLLLHRVGDHPFYVISRIPNSYIRENIPSVASTVLLSAVVVAIAAIFVSVLFSAQFTRRITTLSTVIGALRPNANQGTLEPLREMADKPSRIQDELDALAATLRRIVLRNDENFDENIKLSLQEEKLKYQLLQAQINPHFLYNILDSIQSCISIGNDETARRMTLGLSSFYREVLHGSGSLISIEEELRIAELYLALEAQCRRNRVTWSIHMDEGIGQFQIPKFSLQPILENSVVHGMGDGDASMHITIAVTYEEDTIRIALADNGSGMSTEKLREVQRVLQDQASLRSKFYGINNVNQRLHDYLSNVDRIEIDSAPGQGTRVVIQLQQIIDFSEEHSF